MNILHSFRFKTEHRDPVGIPRWIPYIMTLFIPTALQSQPIENPVGAGRVLRDLAYVEAGHPRNGLDLYLPKEGRDWPLVVWVHGGAWRAGSKDRTQAVDLVKNGYAVASINYRLSQHAVFPAQIIDCKSAIRFLKKQADQYGYNPQKIGVWGSSAGGHLVALLGVMGDAPGFDLGENLDVDSRIQAVCDFFGPIDFQLMNQQSKVDGPMDHDAPNSPESMLIGAPVQDNPELVQKANPISYISAQDPPFLILHGDMDPLVPIQQSQMFHEALKSHGIDSEFLRIEGAGHGFRDREVFPDVLAFFEKHLR